MAKNALSRILIVCLLLGSLAASQQSPSKPLTNDDIVKMTKSGLNESVIVNAIRANPTQFDVSASALINMNKAGVSQKVLDAMIEAAGKQKSQAQAITAAPASSAAGSTPTAASATPSAPVTVGQPTVTLVQGGAKLNLAADKTQIAQTKTNADSLNALASDAVLGQVLQTAVQGAATEAMIRSHSAIGATMIGQTGGIMGGLMGKKKKPTVTYVWALAGQTAANAAPNTPAFEVNFAGIPGVNPEEYQPVLVKLVPTQSNWRLVGATQAKSDAQESALADWEVYSSFIEQGVPVQAKKVTAGQYQVSPASALAPGEYGLVLRPMAKNKKFSGNDIAKNQGEGLLFNSVWAFSVK